jgi:hypothetical protein
MLFKNLLWSKYRFLRRFPTTVDHKVTILSCVTKRSVTAPNTEDTNFCGFVVVTFQNPRPPATNVVNNTALINYLVLI